MATDPALIGWQRFGRFHLPQENRSYKFAHQDTYRRVGLPPEREAAGRNPRHQIRNQCSRPHTKMRNVMMNISWATPRNGLALSRHQLTLSRLWREVMNKEGDVPEAVGMLCQSDLRLRL